MKMCLVWFIVQFDFNVLYVHLLIFIIFWFCWCLSIFYRPQPLPNSLKMRVKYLPLNLPTLFTKIYFPLTHRLWLHPGVLHLLSLFSFWCFQGSNVHFLRLLARVPAGLRRTKMRKRPIAGRRKVLQSSLTLSSPLSSGGPISVWHSKVGMFLYRLSSYQYSPSSAAGARLKIIWKKICLLTWRLWRQV